MNIIPLSVKKRCLEMSEEGSNTREIYNQYFVHQFDNPQSYNAFRRSLLRWKDKVYPDDTTLECGTYEGFVAHGATVQVSSTGQIVQAWIKQTANESDVTDLVNAIKESVEPYVYTPKHFDDSRNMLEIPLFDMHWGIAFMDYYKPVLDEILELIMSKHWARIVIPFGQDFFHNDSIVNGQTTKGTVIEKVDMGRAVKEGRQFIYSIIDTALENSEFVDVIYTPGNHDRSISWLFMQVLVERYGANMIDDSMDYRKIVTYGKNSIMVTHGDSKQATSKNLAHIFPVSFPEEFANANVREVHAGHLHRESEADIYGVMVRRLSSGSKSDEWSDREDFIGAHKRFMLFEWSPDKLNAIHYI